MRQVNYLKFAFSLLIVCCVTSTPQLLRASEADDANNANLEAQQIQTCKALEAVKAATPPAEIYKIFNDFCIANYGAKAEPLVHTTFGSKAQLVDKGTWIYASHNSAVIAFESNIPVWSQVAYSATDAEKKMCAKRERPFYIHVHFITDLQAGTEYTWQTMLTDEFGKKTQSKKLTFTTQKESDLIAFPGKQTSLPYIINKPGNYVLTKDINAEQTAIEIQADDVSLDLGGHTITYAKKLMPKSHFPDKWSSHFKKGSFGIKCMSKNNISIRNGRIQQGAAENRGNNESCGFNALYLRALSNVILEGLEIDYHSPQTAGIRNRAAKDNYLVHHNIIRDSGCKMQNRHGSGCSAIDFLGSKSANRIFHHNLVARPRQNGLRGSPE